VAGQQYWNGHSFAKGVNEIELPGGETI